MPNMLKNIQLLAVALATIVNIYNNNNFSQKDNDSVPKPFWTFGKWVKKFMKDRNGSL